MIMAAAAGASAAKKAVGKIESALSSYDHAKDRARQQNNTLAYNAATATGGSVAAFNYLKGRSGQFGLIGGIPPIPGIYDGQGPVGGWASPPARQDAMRKYQALRPRYEAGTLPVGDGQRTGTDPVTGQPSVERAGLGGISGWGLVVVVGIAVALFIGVKRRES